MTKHCATCTCDSAQRLADERRERERQEREEDFARRHSVLRDEQLEWARSQTRGAR